MKKILAFILAALMIVAAFAGCAAKKESSSAPDSQIQQSQSSSQSSKEHYVFGYSPSTLNNPFFKYIEDTARGIIEGKGDTMVSADPQSDQMRQNSQIEDLVTQGIDILLLNPVDARGVRHALEMCQKAEVPIVNFDTDVYDTELVDCILMSNNENAGYVVGKKVLEDFPDGATYAVMHYPIAQSAVARVDGFKKALSEASNADAYVEVANQDGKASTEGTLPVAENVLQGNPDLGLFFCINDPSALGAVAALEAGNKTGDVKVYSIDGAPEGKAGVKNGKIAGIGAQSPKAIAEDSVKVAYQILAGETVAHDISVDTFLIDESNVDQYGIDSWQ